MKNLLIKMIVFIGILHGVGSTMEDDASDIVFERSEEKKNLGDS
jgi:hypothetical protein